MSSLPPRKVTILDVAARAGVSRTSVSNFFHRPAKISDATRERIRSAMDELGFSPNDAARTLRTGSSPVVGYVAFELASARTPEIANAIAARLAEAGLFTLLATDQDDLARELEYLRLFERQRVSGLIVSPLGRIEDELLRIRRTGIPIVLAGRRSEHEELPSVSVDHRAGGRLAAQHLLDTGRRSLAFVTDTLAIPQIRDRHAGMLEAVEATHGATLEVIGIEERTISGGAAARAAVRERRPDGLLCVNDLVAVGITSAGGSPLAVPEEMAVVGYDDIGFAASNRVPLTTVHAPQGELGETAAELLLEQLDGSSVASRHVVFTPELTVRSSSMTDS